MNKTGGWLREKYHENGKQIRATTNLFFLINYLFDL